MDSDSVPISLASDCTLVISCWWKYEIHNFQHKRNTSQGMPAICRMVEHVLLAQIGSYMTQVKSKLWYVYQAQSVHSKVNLQWLGICGGSLWKRFWIPHLASVIQLYFGTDLRFTVNFKSFCLAVSLINSLYSVPGSSFACSMGVVLPLLTTANSK